MPIYDSIQPSAFHLRADVTSLPITVMHMAFPDSWKRTLRDLRIAGRRGRSDDESRLAVASLNKALRALIPDIITIAPDADRWDRTDWILARRRVDPQIVHAIVSAWMRTEYASSHPDGCRHALGCMHPSDLRWEERTIDVAAWNVSANGTATARQGESFALLPDIVASHLADPHITMTIKSERLSFRRAPSSFKSAGAEVVSWPPLHKTDRFGRAWRYSVVIGFTVQTVPFQPFPVLHCRLGVRRWVSMPVQYLPSGEATSVHLSAHIPWISGVAPSSAFQAAMIRWDREKKTFVWDDNLSRIIDNLDVQHAAFPDASQICANPSAYLDGDRIAAIVHRNGIRPDHPVHPGMMPENRRALVEQLCMHLAPWVELASPFRKCYPGRSARISQTPMISADADAHASRIRKALADSIGARDLAMELYVQTDHTRAALMHAIERHLGIAIGDGNPATVDTPELRITVRCNALGEFGMPLDIASGSGSRLERVQRATRDRITRIATRVGISGGPIAAFVELQGKDAFDDGTDPKIAIRAGFAATNRLTQFLEPGDDAMEHRAMMGVRDMIRQLGVILDVPDVTSLGIARATLFALWILHLRSAATRRTQVNIPLFVAVDTATKSVAALAPGWRQWMPYAHALLMVARESTNARWTSHMTDDGSARFIATTIRDHIARAGEALLLVHAQNVRRTCPWFSNDRIMCDAVQIGERAVLTLRDAPGMRMLRIRDRQGDETAQWYAVNGHRTGFASGLFVVGPRTFASTMEKPRQFKHVRIGADLDDHAWNPAILEMTAAALQPGDSPVLWSAYVHELRRPHVQYDEPTLLPLPMHLARQAEEYAAHLDESHRHDDGTESHGNDADPTPHARAVAA